MERVMKGDSNGLNVLNRLEFVIFSPQSECRPRVVTQRLGSVFSLTRRGSTGLAPHAGELVGK